MSLLNLDLDSLTFSDIQNLITNEVYESKFIEYKRELVLSSKDGKVEFLNDVTAFANAEGGDLIFGIDEEEGKPGSIRGLQIAYLDEFKLQIEGILRDNISPRIKYEIRFIECEEDKYILVIRIPSSTNAPHMVTLKGQGFYIRNLSGKHKMDINELRECFLTSAGYSKDAYLFHLKDELTYNKNMLRHLGSYLDRLSPIKSAFEPLSVGSHHFRLEAWNALVRAGILPLLPFEQQKLFQDADKSIRETARIIQIDNAEWKTLWDYRTGELIPGMGEPYTQEFHVIQKNFKSRIINTLHDLELALQSFVTN